MAQRYFKLMSESYFIAFTAPEIFKSEFSLKCVSIQQVRKRFGYFYFVFTVCFNLTWGFIKPGTDPIKIIQRKLYAMLFFQAF